MSKRRTDVARAVTRVAIGAIGVGVFCLCQPWWFSLYENGFQILLARTVVYVISSHLE